MSDANVAGRIFLVLDGDAGEPVVYSHALFGGKCDVKVEVERANRELGLGLGADEVLRICSELQHNRAYWVGERYCFDSIYF